MDSDSIQLATSPDEVAALIDAAPKMSNPSGTASSGASVDQILAQIEGDKMSKEDQAKALEALREKSKPKPQPINLEYKFTGTCPNCGIEVETLQVNIAEDLVVIAYCNKDKQQLQYNKVSPLNKQNEIKNETYTRIQKGEYPLEQGEKGITDSNERTKGNDKSDDERQMEESNSRRKSTDVIRSKKTS